MKKIKDKIADILQVVVYIVVGFAFLPIVLLIFIGLFLIVTPLDYFKYKRSRYYKDTKEKYSWLCNANYPIKLYDYIKIEGLPIEFHRDTEEKFTGCGYFIYKDVLIYTTSGIVFDEENNKWALDIGNGDDNIDLYKDVMDEIARCNEFLKREACKSAVVLIDKELLKQHLEFTRGQKFKGELANMEFLPVDKDDFQSITDYIKGEK